MMARNSPTQDRGTLPLGDGARAHVVEVWDEVVRTFLSDGENGAPPLQLPSRLQRWANGYHGKGVGAIEWRAFPEPYVGALDSRPLMVVLALNPGRASESMQFKDGVLAGEIRTDYDHKYSAWAKSWPFLRDVWEIPMGKNVHHARRLEFMRRWWYPQEPTEADLVAFELYPWHSSGVTARMHPDADVIREFVLDPVREFGNVPVFAFGAPWFEVLEKCLGAPSVCLGAGGCSYGSRVATRSVAVFELSSEAKVIAVKQSGYAGPPSQRESAVLREALANEGVEIHSVTEA